MKRRAQRGRRLLRSAAAWCVAVVWAFPLLYMLLTSFKAEADAVPPSLWLAHPTLQNYGIVLQQQIFRYLEDSGIISVATVAICILVGVPTSYVIVFGRLRKADNLFFWFLSTTLLPPVAMIIPVFLLFRVLGLLDTLGGMILVFSGVNIPIVIWMIRAFLLDVPREILDSADLDGASRLRSFFATIVPLCRQGIVSVALLVFIFVWNEFFFSINLTYVNAAPVPVYMAGFMTQEGLFWAKLSAISTLVILPPSILGWFAQRSLVKGLTAGSVKG